MNWERTAEWAAPLIALAAGLLGIFTRTQRETPKGVRPTAWAWLAALVLVAASSVSAYQAARTREEQREEKGALEAQNQHVRGQLEQAHSELLELRTGQTEQLAQMIYRTARPSATYEFEVRTGSAGTNNRVTARLHGHFLDAPSDQSEWSPWFLLDAPGNTFEPNKTDKCVVQIAPIDRIDRVQIRHAPGKESTWTFASLRITDLKAGLVYEADVPKPGYSFSAKATSYQFEVKGK